MNPENLRTLVTYSASSTNTQTTRDFLDSFADHLTGRVEYLHVTHEAQWDVDFNDYDVVVNNYCVRLCYHNYTSKGYLDRMRNFRGLKIAVVQDEYNHTNLLKAQLKGLGIHVLLTCVPQNFLDYVYPRAEVGALRMETVLTGYVPASNGPEDRRPLADRPTVIGYRGRDIGGLYGRLGFDKYEIGRRMKEVCDARGIPCDIRMDEDSRIYGPAWREFLRSCHVTLGSESGSNVFDFDDSLRRRFDEIGKALGYMPRYSEFISEIGDRENAIEMGQVSPRIFEYAEAFTPMILFRGRYSDTIVPDEHYIMLEKDFSNIDDVLRRVEDLPGLEAMADRAYDRLIGSGRYSYKVFVDRLADIIFEELPRLENPRGADPGIAASARDGFHPVLVERPTLRPMEFESFELQYGLMAFEAEVRRMSRLEQQVLDGFEAGGCTLLIRSTAAGASAARGASESFLADLTRFREAFARLGREREMIISEHFSDGAPRSDDAVRLARGIYQRQMNEMYELFGAINAAYTSAAGAPAQA